MLFCSALMQALKLRHDESEDNEYLILSEDDILGFYNKHKELELCLKY